MNCPECPATVNDTDGKRPWCPVCGWPIEQLHNENQLLKRKLMDAETAVRDTIRRLRSLLGERTH